MSGYKWRDPARRQPPRNEPEMPPAVGRIEPVHCVFCGETGVLMKRLRGKDPVCADDEACLSRGWHGDS